MRIPRQPAFLLGFFSAIGLVLATTVVAFAENESRTRSSAANGNGPPAVTEMASLGSTRTAADALPASFDRAVQVLGERPEGVPDDLIPGTLLPAKSRKLLSDVGAVRGDLYAVPTTRGKVCFVFSAGPAGCVDRFRRDKPDATMMGDASGAIVFGLLPDDTVDVRVVVDGVARRPLVTKNAYFLEVSDGRPEAVRVTYAGGRAGETVLPPAPPMPS